MTTRRLLIISCSQSKTSTPEPLPLDLVDTAQAEELKRRLETNAEAMQPHEQLRLLA